MADDPPAEADRDAADSAAVDRAVAILTEHFEVVTVMVSRFESDGSGTTQKWKCHGNWFARIGQVREWLTKREAESRVEARREMDQGE